MAAVSSTNKDQSFSMVSDSLAFKKLGDLSKSPTALSWANDSNRVTFQGQKFDYDEFGVVNGGTINSFSVDLGKNGGTADFKVSGLSVDLTQLAGLFDNISATRQDNLIWHTILAGKDTIELGSSKSTKSFAITVAGDGRDAEQGTSFTALADKFTGNAGTGSVYGDFIDVKMGAAVYGGNDSIKVIGSEIAGDARDVYGFLQGGDDGLVTQAASKFRVLSGDAILVETGGTVIGGADVIKMAAAKSIAIGDVSDVSGALIGGEDTITGSSGGDEIYGDAKTVGLHAYAKGAADLLHGGGGADIIYGDWLSYRSDKPERGGNDKLFGDGGSDKLYGNGGNDMLDGGTGNDTMLGGNGDDTYIVDSYADILSESGTKGRDLVESSVNFTLRSGFENLTLTGSADLKGQGNSQDNVIIGNVGQNLLAGNGGDDTFVFATKLKSSNFDIISDFGPSTDVFYLNNSAFKGMSAGAISSSNFQVIKTDVDTDKVDSNDYFLYDKNDGDLYFDRDGSGTTYDRVKFAQVDNDTDLTYADFVIY